MALKDRVFLILGHKGMLGQTAVKYFSRKGYQVKTIPFRFDSENKWQFIEAVRKFHSAVIINCVGRIKQKTDDEHEMLWANTILPLELNNHLMPNQTLIHPSTDCVYDGKTRSAYHVVVESNARDTYGWSKRLGEIALQNRKNTLILRVSIIGLDNSPKPKGLLGWFLSQPPKSTLKGYTNHLWNGITTLEWCKQAEKYLLTTRGYSKESKLLQLGTREHYTKYDLLKLFQEVFNTNHTIEPFETPQPIDRRLIPQIHCHPLENQLRELRSFW